MHSSGKRTGDGGSVETSLGGRGVDVPWQSADHVAAVHRSSDHIVASVLPPDSGVQTIEERLACCACMV